MSDEDLDEESVFFEEIETNPGICGNCYRRVKSFSKPHHELPDCVTDHTEYENHVNKGWFDDYAFSGNPSVKRSYCKCGIVDEVKIRPLDKEQYMETAKRIRERLDEEDIALNEDKFFDVVKDAKGDSDRHFNEEKKYEKAVEESMVPE